MNVADASVPNSRSRGVINRSVKRSSEMAFKRAFSSSVRFAARVRGVVVVVGGGTGRGVLLGGEGILQFPLVLSPGVVVRIGPAVVPVGCVEFDNDEVVLEATAALDSQAVGQAIEFGGEDVGDGKDECEEEY